MILILSALTFLVIVGLIDDFFVIKPYQKLAGQAIAAFFLLKAGLYFEPNSSVIINYLCLAVSFVWHISIMNAFNLIDVMDGLAATSAIFASLSFLFIAFILGHQAVIIFLILFTGSLIAFLLYNKPPAKIYLGDAGSLFVGGFLSVVAMILMKNIYNYTQTFIVIIIPVIVLVIPILELISLVIIRTYKKIPFYLGSPDHFSIYLQRKGWSKNKILLFVSIGSIIPVSILYLFMFNYICFSIFLLLQVICLLLWCKIIY